LATFPERALAWVNGVLVTVTDTLMNPLLGLPPLVSLLLLSLMTAAAMVPVIARTTDQPQLRRVKRRLQAALFEIRLFNDEPATVLRAVGDALRHNLTYLRLYLVPLAVLTVPLTLVVAHLNPFYGSTGLPIGSTALLKVERSVGDPRRDEEIVLEAPAAVKVETAAVQLVGAREVLWRITPMSRGDFIVTVRVGQDAASKTLHVSNGVWRRSPMRVRPGIANQLLHPSEPPLDGQGPWAAIAVTYPDRVIDILGVEMNWMLVYVALTMGWALVVARLARISI
jgi:hypothetical protein